MFVNFFLSSKYVGYSMILHVPILMEIRKHLWLMSCWFHYGFSHAYLLNKSITQTYVWIINCRLQYLLKTTGSRLTSSLKWTVEHCRSVPMSLWGFHVTESALHQHITLQFWVRFCTYFMFYFSNSIVLQFLKKVDKMQMFTFSHMLNLPSLKYNVCIVGKKNLR